MVKNKKGFTLVELLAVIVILAIILVIAVPQIMKTIDESRDGALSSSAKLIAASAEREYLVRQTLGDTDFDPENVEMECEEVAETTTDYESCSITFNNGKASVTLVGEGKFAGKYVCAGTRESATVTESACSGGTGGGNQEPTVTPVSFTRDSWSTIVAAVSDGTYPTEYAVGSTKTIDLDVDGNGTDETYTLRVANATACDNTWMNDTTKSQTACGFVLEFAEVIGAHAMNSNNSNAGGWPASEMRTYLSGTILPKIEAVIGTNTIKTTRVISGYGYEYGKKTNYSSDDKLYLLSTYEVWGSNPGHDSAATNTITRQLDYYEDNSVTIASPNREGEIKIKLSGTESSWWLRSAASNETYNFYLVNANGGYSNYYATSTFGVSPAFRIG